MKFDHLIVDSSSLINFFKYYHSFTAQNYKDERIIFEGLQEFLISKVKSGEIIILDKVFEELKHNKYDFFKTEIKKFIIDTMPYFERVQELTDKYYITENEKFYNNDKTKISEEIDKFENKYADLYLVVYASHLKEQGNNVLLISEESFSKDNKMFPKIPYICKKENEDIWCRDLPYALFEFYKDEPEFEFRCK